MSKLSNYQNSAFILWFFASDWGSNEVRNQNSANLKFFLFCLSSVRCKMTFTRSKNEKGFSQPTHFCWHAKKRACLAGHLSRVHPWDVDVVSSATRFQLSPEPKSQFCPQGGGSGQNILKSQTWSKMFEKKCKIRSASSMKFPESGVSSLNIFQVPDLGLNILRSDLHLPWKFPKFFKSPTFAPELKSNFALGLGVVWRPNNFKVPSDAPEPHIDASCLVLRDVSPSAAQR